MYSFFNFIEIWLIYNIVLISGVQQSDSFIYIYIYLYLYLYSCMLLSHFSCVWLFATPWTIAHQASLSMEFSRQEYWSGLPFPSPIYSYIYIYIYICIYQFFSRFFSIIGNRFEYSSLHYTAGLCWLSILYSTVYILIPNS